jgi:hypothetical protein
MSSFYHQELLALLWSDFLSLTCDDHPPHSFLPFLAKFSSTVYYPPPDKSNQTKIKEIKRERDETGYPLYIIFSLTRYPAPERKRIKITIAVR